jgi:putative nucleotidyltransferase with HDIG domain
MDASQKEQTRSLRSRILAVLLLTLTGGLVLVSLLMRISLRQPALPVEEGQVSRQDLPAPNDASFISDVLTEQARLEAERAIPPVYSPADPVVSRQQIEKLRTALQLVTSVRANEELDLVQKKTALENLTQLQLQSESVDRVLLMSDPRWATIEQEALSILELVMRGAVREDQLESIRRSLPTLVSLDLTEEQAQVVGELVSLFIIPNSFYSPELTDSARIAAREAVQPISREYLAGETVISRGDVITAADIEALQKLGLVQSTPAWQELLGAASIVIILSGFLWLYFLRRRPPFLSSFRSQVLIAFIFLLFFIGARVIIPNRIVIPYIYPIPAFGMLVTVLFGIEPALVLSIPLAILSAYGMPNAYDLTVYYLITSLCGVLTLGPARRISAFFRAGVAVAGSGAAIILAYRIPFYSWDWVGILTLISAAAFNGAASASLALLLQFLFAQQLGLVTPLQLLEISRPDHPLLQFFLRNAPGTYQHSLQVANLAEQAAETIGADQLLVRVGALYHDCGKAINPQFFIENQLPDAINTHDDMDPLEAAQLVIRHVPDGLVLAHKYHLPARIQDFISEHHGILSTRYQYNRAVEVAGGDSTKVDLNQFRYPGPIPQSRETAVLMLADGVEARTRAERPSDETGLRTIIRRVVDYCQQDGQLDATRLTLRDLHLITESFVNTLRGTFHVRVEYPKMEQTPAEVASVGLSSSEPK